MSEVLVLVEQQDGVVKKVTGELLTLARSLGTPSAVWVGPGYGDAAAAALAEFGRIDVAFVNAGFGGNGSFSKDGASVEHWREMVLTNVLGTALTIRATLDAVKESKGHFLLTGSIAGRVAIPGSLYSSTKWAVNGIGQSLRGEITGSGVRVTLIHPGIVDTPFWDNGSPIHDGLTDDDIANSVLYAISQLHHVDVNEIVIRPTSQSM